MSSTLDHGWTSPTVGADSDTWGTLLDNNWSSLNAILATGNLSLAAWTTAAIRLRLASATYTDTSSSGTVPAVYVDAHKAATLVASSATTYTAAYGCYFEAPIAGTNATFTAGYALGADSIKTASLTLGTGNAALTDYSEGTWTPTLLGSSTPGTPTYVAQEGYWTKIGRLVTVTFYVQISSVTGMVGNLQIGGLPFAMGTVTNSGAKGSGALGTVTGLTHQAGYTAWSLRGTTSGTSVINVNENGSGVANTPQTIANTAAATTLAGCITYFV